VSIFTIRVVDDEDEGIGGVRVKVSFLDRLKGKAIAEQKTDSDGYADFEGDEEGEIEVFLNGTSYGTYEYAEGDEITIEK